MVSIVNGQQLVGVYYYKKRKEGTISKEILVTECSPEKANQLLKKYNT
ncbi:MAG: hypothetical protein Q7R56_01730 [Nanoarchaeota archaeon]|nr:hypothetical protein [Nanoarchaeota archaeon]